MKILATGTAGFIGANFVRYSVSLGREVCSLDALTYAGNLRNLSGLDDHKFIKGDIRDPEIIALLEDEKPDVIVNFAAESHVDRSLKDAFSFFDTNAGGVLNLLDAIKRLNSKARFLQVSSDEVYGSADDGKPFVEDFMLKPSSPYSASKAAAEMMAMAYHRTYGLDIVITRSSNNYGPFQFPEKLIPLFTLNLLAGKKVPVYGDGLNVRDWMHVEDNVLGIWAAMERGKAGEIYNLGGGNPLSNLEIVKLLLELTGRDESYIEFVPDRLGHDRAYLLDSSKAWRELNWKPMINFEEGLEATVQWYKENGDWWSK